MSQKYEKEYISKLTEEEIRNNFKTVAEMEPVGLADKDVLDSYKSKNKLLHEKIQAFFNQINESVKNELYGNFRLDHHSSASIASHYFTKDMGYAIGQIENVLKRGRALYYENNYNGRSYARLLIAAPIRIKTYNMINPEDCLMAVAANLKKNSNSLNNINIYIIEEGQTPHSPSMIDKQSSNNGVVRPSIVTLLQQVIDVKNGTRTLDQVTAIGIDSK